jgi:hypothetical protein
MSLIIASPNAANTTRKSLRAGHERLFGNERNAEEKGYYRAAGMTKNIPALVPVSLPQTPFLVRGGQSARFQAYRLAGARSKWRENRPGRSAAALPLQGARPPLLEPKAKGQPRVGLAKPDAAKSLQTAKLHTRGGQGLRQWNRNQGSMQAEPPQTLYRAQPLCRPQNPPQSPQTPCAPFTGGAGEDNRAFPDRQAMLNLEKPATAYLLEIDATLTSSTLDRTRYAISS